VTDYRAIFDYEAQPKEWVPVCNLCGAEPDIDDQPECDRYGYSVHVDICPFCGLTFFTQRMTREAYAEFYASGAYRRLVSAFHGREINAETIQPEQREYAQYVYGILDPWTETWGGSALLDIGGSTGIVAHHLATHIGCDAAVLDPAPAELERADGLLRFPGTIEDFDPQGRTWDLVTLCQTADHLLDLMGSLRKIRGLLSEEGLFWSDIVDFDKTQEVKIDHPFNLTERTYRAFLERAGFSLLQINYAPDGVHIGFLCKAAK
jgi:hypothetical protein